jgi:hypothetical protein
VRRRCRARWIEAIKSEDGSAKAGAEGKQRARGKQASRERREMGFMEKLGLAGSEGSTKEQEREGAGRGADDGE